MRKKIFKGLTLAVAMSLTIIGNSNSVKADVLGETDEALTITLEDGTTVNYIEPSMDKSKHKAIASESYIATLVNYDVAADNDSIAYTVEYEGESTEYTKEQLSTLTLDNFNAMSGIKFNVTDSDQLGSLVIDDYKALLFGDLGYITGDSTLKGLVELQYEGASYKALFTSEKYSTERNIYSGIEFIGFVSVDSSQNLGYNEEVDAELREYYNCDSRIENIKMIYGGTSIGNDKLCIIKMPKNNSKVRTTWGEEVTNYWYIDDISKTGISLKNNELLKSETSAEYFGPEIEVGKEFSTENVKLVESFKYIDGITTIEEMGSGSSHEMELYGVLDLEVGFDSDKNTNVYIDSKKVNNEGANAVYVKQRENIHGITNPDSTYYFIVLGRPAVAELRAQWLGASVLVGKEINTEKLYVDCKFVGGTEYKEVESDKYVLSSKLITKEGTNTFKVTYLGKETTFNVNGTSDEKQTIEDDDPDDGRVPERLELAYSGSEVEVGNSIDKHSLTLYCYYSDGSVTKAKNNKVNYSSLKIDKIGDNEITALYKTKNTSVIVKGYKYATVRFDSNGGSAVNNITKKIGEKVGSLSTPKKSGYTFEGWYNEQAFSNKVTEDSYVTGDMTLYAKWIAIKYVVRLNPNGGTGQVVTMNCNYGTEYVITANQFVRNGYKFVGWDKDQKATRAKYGDKATFSNLTTEDGKTINLYAIWDDGSGSHTGPGDGKTDPKDDSGDKGGGNGGSGGNGGNNGGGSGSGGNGGNGGSGSGGNGDDGTNKPMDGNDPRYEVIDKDKDSDKDGIPDWIDNDDDNDGILDKDDTDDDGDGIKDEQDPDYRWLTKDGTPKTGDSSLIIGALLLLICSAICLLAFLKKDKFVKKD